MIKDDCNILVLRILAEYFSEKRSEYLFNIIKINNSWSKEERFYLTKKVINNIVIKNIEKQLVTKVDFQRKYKSVDCFSLDCPSSNKHIVLNYTNQNNLVVLCKCSCCDYCVTPRRYRLINR